jgi:hypothetical protein
VFALSSPSSSVNGIDWGVKPVMFLLQLCTLLDRKNCQWGAIAPVDQLLQAVASLIETSIANLHLASDRAAACNPCIRSGHWNPQHRKQPTPEAPSWKSRP